MNKDKSNQIRVEISDHIVYMDDIKVCDFEISKPELNDGRGIATFEANIKCKGTVDSRFEFNEKIQETE